MLKRITLFLGVNLLILLTLSFLTSVLGLHPYLQGAGLDYSSLAVFCLVWGMGGAFISLQLSRFLAKRLMNIAVIDPRTSNPAEQSLLQTVYRLAKGAGLNTMPEVGIYDAPDMNAFATGPSRSRALVAVSTGILRGMDQASLEGVLGHEISHIANGDMVTLTLIQGVLNAFVMFLARAITFAISSFLRDRDDEGRGLSPLIQMFVVMLLEMVLGLFAAIVVAWFSRYREYRADSGGARLAGRDSMISALRTLQRRYETDMNLAEQAGTQPEPIRTFAISSRTQGFIALLASHPPLAERIQRLELMRG